MNRYAEAIAASGPLPSNVDALRTRERRRVEPLAQLHHGDNGASRPECTTARDLRRRAMQRLHAWNALLERNPIQARQTVIRPLLEGRIILTPHRGPAGRFYELPHLCPTGALVSGLVAVVGLVPPG